MTTAPDTGGESRRRRYDSPVRRQRAAETRERIVAAGSELVHGFAHWDWRELTFRAVAERAGVGERTVYRHFPSERVLHDAVMQRLEEEAGVRYEDVTLATMTEVMARVFASRASFAVGPTVEDPQDPAFDAADARRQDALRRAVTESAPHWSEVQQETAAALLDVVWNLPAYEHLVGHWRFDTERATAALAWLVEQVVASIEGDRPPGPPPRARARRGSRSRAIS